MAEDHRRPAGDEVKYSIFVVGALLAAALPQHALATPAYPPGIEQRLRRAEDELAIRRLLIDYAWTQDARDFAAYAALFARNGEWINGSNIHKGPADIRKMLDGIYGTPVPGYVNRESFHITTNIEISIDGDHATASSRHLLFTRGPDGRPKPTLAGQYHDDLTREDSVWKFLRRVDTPVMPTPEEWSRIMRSRKPGQ
jgi:uncharacterized protein (TIGR02246 family)